MKHVYRNGRRFTIVDSLQIQVPRGFPTDNHSASFLRFKEKGEQFLRTDILNGQLFEFGDVVVQVVQKRHPTLSRISGGHHLWYEQNISLKDALVGTDRTWTIDNHPSGKPIAFTLQNERVVNDGYIHRVKGMGMPLLSSDRFGDLFVKFNVIFPDVLSELQQSQIHQIFTTADNRLSHQEPQPQPQQLRSKLWDQLASSPLKTVVNKFNQ